MIDLSAMRAVVIDATNRIARVSAGVRLGELDAASAAHGLATTLGVNTDTGIAGLTLGGGYGWLAGRFGLACDNLIGAEVVTADGRSTTGSTWSRIPEEDAADPTKRNASFGRRKRAAEPESEPSWLTRGGLPVQSTVEGDTMERTHDYLLALGRVLMSGLFVWGGYGKLMAPGATAQYFAQVGVTFVGGDGLGRDTAHGRWP